MTWDWGKGYPFPYTDVELDAHPNRDRIRATLDADYGLIDAEEEIEGLEDQATEAEEEKKDVLKQALEFLKEKEYDDLEELLEEELRI
jgi:hypothetical protein